MRSPMMRGALISTTLLALHTEVSAVRGEGVYFLSASISRSFPIYSGVVPQQPPAIFTP